MTKLGIPAFADPQSGERDLLLAIQAIRARLVALESIVTGQAALSTTVQQLTKTVTTTTAAAASPQVTFQIGGTTQGVESTVNFASGANVSITGVDNTYNGVFSYTIATVGLVGEAPLDGNVYARQNGAWISITATVPIVLVLPREEVDWIFDEFDEDDAIGWTL